jgi:hypothetical protein
MEEINLPDSYEMLAKVMPSVLEEEILLVELKNNTSNESIKSVMLLTLNPEFCDINTKPYEYEDEYHMWCWNLKRNQWILLDFSEVESAENWPPINDK